MRCLIFLCLSPNLWAFAFNELSFRQIGLEEGLSQSRVTSLLHPPGGYLWVGTQDGLNRYDGYQFRVFRHDPKDPHSLSNSHIISLAMDVRDVLWVGTYNGLNRYDKANAAFQQVHLPAHAEGNHYQVAALADWGDKILVGTNKGLFCLDEAGRSLSFTDEFPGNNLKSREVTAIWVAGNTVWVGTKAGLFVDTGNGLGWGPLGEDAREYKIRAICGDGLGGIWVASDHGLAHIAGNGDRTWYRHDPLKNSVGGNDLWSLALDHESRLWIGTEGAGLDVFDPESGLFQHYRETDPQVNFKGKNVWSIARDPHEGMWLGTFGGGLNRVASNRLRFHHEEHKADDPGSLSHNMVLGIYRTDKGDLWVGSDRGLNLKKAGSQTFRTYKHDPQQPGSLNADAVTTIKEDLRGRIWVGTWGGGLHLYQPNSDDFQSFPLEEGISKRETVISLLPIAEGLLIGTVEGLYLMDPAGGVLRYQHEDGVRSSLSNDSVFALHQDREELIWVGTRGGFNRFEREAQGFKRYDKGTKGRDRPSSDTILAIHEDLAVAQTLWLATALGVNRFDTSSEHFTVFDLNHGLPNNTIYGILEDEWGLLWISTNKGLAVADKQFEQCRVLDRRDGLPGDEFNAGAYFADQNHLYFGGLAGLIYFQPKPVFERGPSAQVLMTDFFLNNRPIQPKAVDPDSPLFAELADGAELTLTYKDFMIGFSFASTDFSAPWHTRYRYRLEPLEETWIETGPDHRRATYTNLPPGRHSFHVMASDANGYWHEPGARVTLEVLAPPWLRWWAKLFYALVLIGLFYWYYAMQQEKLGREREIARQQRQIAVKDRATAERLRELDKLKDAFLANTSHELRTPLNGIIGLAEGLMADGRGRLSERMYVELGIIANSGRRLANLVNDILDFSKLKQKDLQLSLESVSLHELVESVLVLSGPAAQAKGLVLNNEVAPDFPAVLADRARLDQILHNLVGNAVKFTHKGEVVLSAVVGDRSARISVRDTGIGIEPEARQRIFQSFQQGDGGVARSFGGTGLGLAISRRLINLHGSEIDFESIPGKGTTFSFDLALSDEPAQLLESRTMVSRLQPETATYVSAELSPDSVPAPDEAAAADPADNHREETRENRYRILVVDDEPVNRRVLINHLRPRGYQLLEAGSGDRCLEMIEEQRPDMVLLDIMMPDLSGYEVCRSLRKKYHMDDLPVIFLTARNRVEDMVKGFDAGANDFVTKPVARQELLARVNTHLQLLDINRALETKVEERSRALITSQKQASLATLATGLAHEINNPNNFVSGGAQILEDILEELKENLETGEITIKSPQWDEFFSDLAEQAGLIRQGSKRITEVIRHLRIFAGKNKKMEQMDFMPSLTAMANLLAAKYPDITITHEEDWSRVLICRPGELSQAFLGLMINGIEAIEARRQREKDAPARLSLKHYLEEGYLVISIEDTGVGIPEKHRDKLFDPFFTTKRGGATAGLGLYTAWEVVSEHKGRIELCKTSAQGSEFLVYLPLPG